MSHSEAQTRADKIDKHLAKAGWNVTDPTQVMFSDFVLLVKTAA